MTGTDLSRWATHRIRDGWMPGAAWTLSGAEGSIVGAAGSLSTDTENVQLVSPHTIYDLASLTKPLSTSLLLSLMEQEALVDLRAPLSETLIESRGTPYEGVSPLQLASHQSALPAWSPLFLDDRGGTLVERVLRLPPAVKIGQTLYSDPGYMLLGALLERVADESLASLFERRIARPLGLKRMGYRREGEPYADAAPTEDGNRYEREMAAGMTHDPRWRTVIPPGEVHDANAHALGGSAGHAGLFGSIDEVVAIARELLDPRRLPLSPATRQRLLSEFHQGRSLGFEAAVASSATRGLLPDGAAGHTGFTGTSLWIDTEADVVYVLLSNRVHPRVSPRSFQRLRRSFHRLARRITLRAEWAGDGPRP